MTDEPKAPPGAYRFTDHSVLRPWVTQVWFARLFPLLPRWLAANVVTLISTGTLASIVLGSIYSDRLGPGWFALLQLVALQLYVAGDHLDGMQAKASGTMSPLGDFLDHHCDLWAGCVLIFGYWSLTGSPLWTLYAMTITLIVGFAITYVERAERKALHFTAWGTLEALAIVSAFYLSWCIPVARRWWQRELQSGLPRHMLIAGLGTAMCVGAIIIIAARLRRLPLPLLLNTATLIAMAAYCSITEVPPMIGWLAVVLVGADYVARVMQAHTTTQPRPWPDLFTPVAVLLLVLRIEWDLAFAFIVALPIWLALRYIITMARIISGWRQHWVWFNPRVETRP